jgi:hypothetical protein
MPGRSEVSDPVETGTTRQMKALAVPLTILALAIAGAGCGSDDDQEAGGAAGGTTTGFVTTTGATTPFSADDVEEALAAELESGGGVHELENNAPGRISCERADVKTEWECTITPAGGGDDLLCMVDVDSATRTVSKRECGSFDN